MQVLHVITACTVGSSSVGNWKVSRKKEDLLWHHRLWCMIAVCLVAV